MKVHVLDTGAIYALHDKHKPPIIRELEVVARDDDCAIWIPAVVLAEAGQARQLFRKRLDRIFELAEVASLDERVAESAAAGLRGVMRAACATCAGFIGPSLVDAIVMAFAAQYTDGTDTAVVHTTDAVDMTALRDRSFARVELRGW